MQQLEELLLSGGESIEGSVKPSTRSKSPWSSFTTYAIQSKRVRNKNVMEKHLDKYLGWNFEGFVVEVLVKMKFHAVLHLKTCAVVTYSSLNVVEMACKQKGSRLQFYHDKFLS